LWISVFLYREKNKGGFAMRVTMYKTIVGLAAAAVLSTGVVYANTSPAYKVGDVFKEQIKGLTGTNYVMEQQEIDVTGDNIDDNIIILGQKETKEDVYHSKVNILVKDGKTKSLKLVPVGGGYDGTVKIGDFDGNHINDVAISLQNGGSGGTVNSSVVSFDGANPKYILKDGEGHELVKIKGKYIDDFKAEIEFLNIKKTIVLDLSAKKDQYIESEIYDKDGKLLKEVEPWTDGLKTFNLVDLNGDETLEVMTSTSICGDSHVDRISRVDLTMQYLDGKWDIKKMSVSQPIIENPLKSYNQK
jgi:hypothetical protein